MAIDHENRHGCAIGQDWIGTSSIAAVMASGSRDGQLIQATHLCCSIRITARFVTSLCTNADGLLQPVAGSMDS